MPSAAPLAFLPIVTKARELDARILLAAHLAKSGFQVVVGSQSFVDYRARYARNAIVFSPLLVPGVDQRLKAYRARGHRIIAWDEEGLVYPDPAWYFANRVDSKAAAEADALIAWGEVAGEDWQQTLPDGTPRPLPLGNARIELLRAPFRQLHAADGEGLRQRFGRYILVNTNFDMVNHADGPGGLERRLRATGRLSTARDEQKFIEWSAFRQMMFDAFLDGLPRLHEALPQFTFVLRPHPSEAVDTYQALADTLPRLSIEPASGSVLPWILGAEAILHNSCTTALEAFMLDVPPIAYAPPTADETDGMASPLPNLLSRRCADWEDVIAALESLPGKPQQNWQSAEQIATARRYIGGFDGPLSSELIADLSLQLAEGLPAPVLGGPDPIRRLRRAAGAMGEKLGVRLRAGEDDRRRFPGLPLAEVNRLADAIGGMIQCPLSVTPLEPDTYIIARSGH
ncbi:hypothetical protein GRI97_08935 [Altererythrobacter xixiisoli]|uniref:Surface carbohydrate biosynthesis protein n=1 Tax=Croceibacterium xixiisoli TaxID=1476466 RepID=A0A6I4TTB2_9SPHN|nr:surface carbohydrate biosynthesis protein [Croceibacterium xixiisoli]MXO99112.1 hypothetical protein [Croceibacterium xixiisoli]